MIPTKINGGNEVAVPLKTLDEEDTKVVDMKKEAVMSEGERERERERNLLCETCHILAIHC